MSVHERIIVDRSVLNHQWVLQEAHAHTKENIARTFDLPDIVLTLLAARGVTIDQIGNFLDPKIKNLMPDPYHLLGMQEAVERIIVALQSSEPIGIIGDYDVDGACSSAILAHFLQALGASVFVRIPDRIRDGYGPSPQLIDELTAKEARLLITLDCGSMSFDALAYARSLGLDVIVIDHHGMSEVMPEAYAIINPKRRDQETDVQILCAAGVTFLTMVALCSRLQKAGQHVPPLMPYLDRVALATICDVVPLTGINRALVRTGLRVMNTQPSLGLAALGKALGLENDVTPYHCGYLLGPHINAGGRVGTADLGYRLLMCSDEQEAQMLAEQAKEQNNLRKSMESHALHEAEAMAQQKIWENKSFVVLYSPDWHIGILGILASRIKEKTHKPVVVLGDCGGLVKGSARSIETLDIGALIHEAVAQKLVCAGGGHAMAAGLTIEKAKIADLDAFLNAAAAKYVITPKLKIDACVAIPALTAELFQSMEKLSPFGSENPKPLLYIAAVMTRVPHVVGQKHIQVKLTDSWGHEIQAIAFQAVGTPMEQVLLHQKGAPLQCVGHLSMNTWNGRTSPQFQIADVSAAA